jgi:drug/metabolite transporter (DMT)-like permease
MVIYTDYKTINARPTRPRRETEGEAERWNSKKLAPAMIVAAGVLWCLMGIFVRRLNGWGLSSPSLSQVRATSTTLLLALILLLNNRKLFRIRLRDVWIFAGGGVFSIVFFNVCYFKAIDLMSLSAAATLMYTSPAFVLLLSAAIFRERITARKVLAIVLTFCGCALVGGLLGGDANITVLGVLCGVGAGLGYALYSIFSRLALLRGYDPMTITFYIFLFAALGSLFVSDLPEIADVIRADPARILYFFLYALVTTILPYILYTAGLKHVPNARASVIVAVEPVTATVVGVLVFHEELTAPALIGMLLVLAAIVIMSGPFRHREGIQ